MGSSTVKRGHEHQRSPHRHHELGSILPTATDRMGPMDPKWTLPSRLADNPMAWLIQVNGLIVDARQAPRDIQEEAFRRGLIPYLP